MKKWTSFLGILLITLIFAACSSSDNSEGTMNPNNNNSSNNDGDNDPNPTGITYTEDIRIIIQSNCISCHSDPPTNNAPMPLTTYAEVKSAVESRGLLTRINSTTDPMPPTGRLPSSTRQLIADWIDLGYPE